MTTTDLGDAVTSLTASGPPHRSTPRRRGMHAAGFTLVEVLVAMLVMAVMAGMAWRGVDGIVRTRDASQTRLDRTLRMNTVVAQWEQDLTAIQDSTALPQALACDGATVRLARHTPTGLQVVAWSLRPDPAGARWVRWAGPSVTTTTDLQQSWAHSQQLLDDEPGAVPALTGLSQWQVYFYQGNGWANCQSTGNLVVTGSQGTTGGSGTIGASGTSPVAGSSAASGAGGVSGTTGVALTTGGGLTNSSRGILGLPTSRIALPSGVRLVLSFAPGSGVDGSLTRDTQVGP